MLARVTGFYAGLCAFLNQDGSIGRGLGVTATFAAIVALAWIDLAAFLR